MTRVAPSKRALAWILGVLLIASVVVGLATPQASAQPGSDGPAARATRLADYWTPQRMSSAVPRDLVVDDRALGYLRRPDGSLSPFGHGVPAAVPRLRADSSPLARPPGGDGGTADTTPPTIADMVPGEGASIGTSQTFSATVTDDASGVKSVTFVIEYPNGFQESFGASQDAGDTWSVGLRGFTSGSWRWQVVAKDNATRGGNTATSSWVSFSCCDGGGDPGGGVTTNARWTNGGAVQTAIGRIYFEMPANRKLTRWSGYVCSGTVASDGVTGRSIIITAAHCVYDDVYKVFARNVLFIPNQDQTTGSGTDQNCSNDPLGCWAPDFGVVDTDWTTRTFPDNIPWDYAYYVVTDEAGNVLDGVAGSLGIDFTPPVLGDVTHALGYSYSDDPYLMYCSEAMTTEGSANWWLPSCGLSGGSSGGSWIQPMDVAAGSGPIISVNSWGYTNQAGMAGPKLSGTSAACVFDAAKTAVAAAIVDCP